MALDPGTRLGPYEIVGPLGAGGMGEVYRARDTRLDRSVAIKVLPAHLSANPELRQRFEREARAVSSLNHPHICVLHDIGHENGTDFLVMEYLEGETLMSRLERGPLPVHELLRIATEIADALDRAHRQSLVHRDLKPGNVMLTKSGAKLLDFGLARTTGLTPDGSGLSQSPTMSRPLTAEWTVVGTFQYMSPEQLEGREADERSDIFAFGAMLYEMATGRRPFEGKSQASLIAAVLKEEPRPITELQPLVPPALERLVRACLAKDPEERRQTMHDVALELRWIAEGGSRAGVPAPVAARRRGRARLAWTVAAVAAAAAAAFAVGFFARTPPKPLQTRFTITPPPSLLWVGSPRLSPDGRTLAFNGADSTGRVQIWLRSMSADEPQLIAGTDGAGRPFWSPDSRFLAFFADGKLKKVAISGGPPQTLCDAPGGADGSWGLGGTLLFDGSATDSLRGVSALGGVAAPVTFIDRSLGETGHAWPCFLPDGKHFLFVAFGARSEDTAIRLGRLGSEETERFRGDFSRAEFTPPGYVVFVRDRTLMAQPFSARKGAFTGEPFPVADNVSGENSGNAEFSVSRSGALAFRNGSAFGSSRLVWIDRTGREVDEPGEASAYDEALISPDGQRLALAIRDSRKATSDIWIRDLGRGVTSRLTFDPADDIWPVWSPDGDRVAFASNRGGKWAVYEKSANGIGDETLLLKSDADVGPLDFSPDGRTLVCEALRPSTGWDIVLWSADGGGSVVPFADTNFREVNGRLSPDGRWLAHASNESGRYEVFVRTVTGSGGKWQVSLNGGIDPHWRRDGKELFYIAADAKLMAVDVQSAGSSFEIGRPRALFDAPPRVEGQAITRYSVAPDGERFLFTTPLAREAISPIRIVLDWTASLAR